MFFSAAARSREAREGDCQGMQAMVQTDRHTDVPPYGLKKDPSAEHDGNRPINRGSSLESM